MARLLAPSAGLWLLVAAPLVVRAQDDEEDGESRYMVIRAGRVITVSGETYQPGEIVIENGKVRLAGKDLEYPRTAEVIEAPGETVMPGLVLARTRRGLAAYSRSGLHAAAKAADEVFLEEIDFEDLLEAGFTTVGFAPAGSGIAGRASVYHTAGPPGSRLLADRSYLRVTMTDPPSNKAQLREAFKKAREAIEKVRKAREEWEKKRKGVAPKKEEEAKEPPPKKGDEKKRVKDFSSDEPPKKEPPEKKSEAASKKDDVAEFEPPEIDPDVQPFVDLLEKKEVPLLFEIRDASDLVHLDDALEGIEGIAGSYALERSYSPDLHHVVGRLGQRGALVLLTPAISRLPYTVNRYSLPAALSTAGCRLAFLPLSDGAREYERVRARASDLVRAGLTRQTALEALTLNPARILRVDDRVGSIEKGKDADLVFLSGDPFSPESRVTRLFIRGEVVWRAER